MKKSLMTICLMALLLALSSCATQEEPTPTESPTATATVTASPTAEPEMSQEPDTSDEPTGTGTLMADTAAGAETPADAQNAVADIELELERLSEVEEAQVVLAGHSAAVALKFDSQYQGGVDDRMREMVEERIKGVISGITTIAITDDTDLLEELRTLGDRLGDAADLTEIQDELDAIIEKINATKA